MAFQTVQTWRNSSNLVHDIGAADTIELRIQELTDILIDESRRPLPHTCLGFASEKQIYVPIGKIAASSYNLNIIKEAVYFFGTLIESEDDAFVESETFASNLTNLFVRITGANSTHLDVETETKVVELAFNITTKIRLRPEILPAWFKAQQSLDGHDGDREKGSGDHERFKGKTQRKDFPLFYVLMDYIHSEGKIGDFARTGLLYIIESASAVSSALLEQWIVESDLSTLMATGLGALYSQLSRKLVIDHPVNSLPPILALSDYEHPRPAFEVDVLNHCRSVEVRSTLLEHFQVIFLQQLLYPSLLESSDIDGGSSVAVLTYLRRIIESLDHPDMINLILHYLLALPDPTTTEPAMVKSAVSAARKRKSMDLATMMAERVEVAATPILFNLVDLILACLKSHNQQTICVTLQLVSTILRRHHRYAVMTLIRTVPISGAGSRRTIGAHQQDVEFFMSIAGGHIEDGNGGGGITSVSNAYPGSMQGGYGISTPISTKPTPVAPKEFPLIPGIKMLSKDWAGEARSVSPGSYGADTNSWGGLGRQDTLVASQMAAFQAVDSKILERRVGIPESQGDSSPIPLRFNKWAPPPDVAADQGCLQHEKPQGVKHVADAMDGNTMSGDEDTAPLEEKTVTVSHILTNTVILQSFLFEIAALLQARAGLFDEVRFV
ncbi:hypothetical protein SPBR_09106 [Sporothrix brasiliensis 5110]|uniref:Uncharacterized protein n=1 Tax=Sporothrix brasiliensis 5110 TaxID=1398154 RepID=A0A0C2FLP1_9PEZI|nr:uncharacterized protein SPBR_09106 [Sporothrix brasiliensis 5110]KIH92003.1 hypothetical protein SPBR_09106 [Sporothrix brasiliensis 5110]